MAKLYFGPLQSTYLFVVRCHYTEQLKTKASQLHTAMRPLDSDEETYLDKMNHEMCMRVNTITDGVNKSNIVIHNIYIFTKFACLFLHQF